MNDSELHVDMTCKKNLDKKYYFLAEKYFCKDDEPNLYFPLDFAKIRRSTQLGVGQTAEALCSQLCAPADNYKIKGKTDMVYHLYKNISLLKNNIFYPDFFYRSYLFLNRSFPGSFSQLFIFWYPHLVIPQGNDLFY